MTKPIAYDPQDGYKWQILYRSSPKEAWEHCDYAVDNTDKKHLLEAYAVAYHGEGQFKVILLPYRYWPKKRLVAQVKAKPHNTILIPRPR